MNCIYVEYGSGEWFGTEATGSVGFPTSCSEELPAFVTSSSLAAIAVQKNFFVNDGNSTDTFDGILGLGFPDLAEPYSPEDCMMDSRRSGEGEELVVSNNTELVSNTTPTHEGPLGGRHGTEARAEGRNGKKTRQREEEMEEEETPATPLLDVMIKNGALDTNLFGISFCGTEGSSLMSFSKGLEANGLTRGANATSATFVPTLQTVTKDKPAYWGYYLVNLNKVTTVKADLSSKVGEELREDYDKRPTELTLGVSPKELNGEVNGHLVDSGTTLLYLTPVVYTLLQTDIREKTMSCLSVTNITGPQNWQKVFKMNDALSEEILSCMPNVILQIGSNESTYDLDLSPSKYMLAWPQGDGTYSYYWAVQKSRVPIIGNVAMNGKTVVFDSTNGTDYAIGFADHDCEAVDTAERCEGAAATSTASASLGGIGGLDIGSMSEVVHHVSSSAMSLSARAGLSAGSSLMIIAMALAVFGALGEKRRRKKRMVNLGYFPVA
jgi:hypothetical protein